MRAAILLPLTPRETEVLNAIVSGSTSREVAARIGVSPRTIDFHRSNIMQKMHARNMADLMRAVLGKREETDSEITGSVVSATRTHSDS